MGHKKAGGNKASEPRDGALDVSLLKLGAPVAIVAAGVGLTFAGLPGLIFGPFVGTAAIAAISFCRSVDAELSKVQACQVETKRLMPEKTRPDQETSTSRVKTSRPEREKANPFIDLSKFQKMSFSAQISSLSELAVRGDEETFHACFNKIHDKFYKESKSSPSFNDMLLSDVVPKVIGDAYENSNSYWSKEKKSAALTGMATVISQIGDRKIRKESASIFVDSAKALRKEADFKEHPEIFLNSGLEALQAFSKYLPPTIRDHVEMLFDITTDPKIALERVSDSLKEL